MEEICVNREVLYTLRAGDGKERAVKEADLIRMIESGEANVSNLELRNGKIIKKQRQDTFNNMIRDTRGAEYVGAIRPDIIKEKVRQALVSAISSDESELVSKIISSKEVLALDSCNMGKFLDSFNWKEKVKLTIFLDTACFLLSLRKGDTHVLLVPSDVHRLYNGWRKEDSSIGQVKNRISDQLHNLTGELIVAGGIGLEDLGGAFENLYKVSSMDISKLRVSKVKYMENMFYNCNVLKSLTCGDFDTSNVTNMSNMFYGCRSLKSLMWSNLDTSNVTNMNGMFYGCNQLDSINLSGFNTSNVIDMGGMFCGCNSLTAIDLSHFNTSNVIDMGNMFSLCSSLRFLDLSHFNTSNVKNMGAMFSGCSDLGDLNFWNLRLNKQVDISNAFRSCKNLKRILVYSVTKKDMLKKKGGETAFIWCMATVTDVK